MSAKPIEIAAISALATRLGRNYRQVDGLHVGDGLHDFELISSGGLIASVEVTTYSNRSHEEVRLVREFNANRWADYDLAAGYLVSLRHKTKIKRLVRWFDTNLPRRQGELCSRPLPADLAAIGVDEIVVVPGLVGLCLDFSCTMSPIVEPHEIAADILRRDPGNVGKLGRSGATERILLVMIDPGPCIVSPVEAPDLPIQQVDLPPEITDIWLAYYSASGDQIDVQELVHVPCSAAGL